ncbi:MAG: 16S rRNA (guanine(527)-N(7))-methyltransferase RsmG [Rhodocyclaceae bacterium]|nr:MAG: 16S rRNA (guanine(527)-N(7))-methyltransferase RsmG [Rhodocyclaceae bacterium]
MTMESELARGIAALGVDLPEEAADRLLAFATLLAKWNRVYNLTALRDESQMLTHHLLDSLAVLPHLNAMRLADIGSGGGLPGIPLAIARPRCEMALVETSHKKASFLQQARIELGLENVEVINDRVEQWHPASQCDAIISRAFSDIVDFVRLTDHLLGEGGRWYAMKGVLPHDEIAQLPAGYRVERVIPLEVPGLGAARHLIVIERG